MTDTHSAFAQLVMRARREGRPELLPEAIPYARLLGIKLDQQGGQCCFHLPASRSNVGNPTLPALHGGAIGGFMELAAVLHLLTVMDTLQLPKVVDFSIDYIRAGKLRDTWASCEVVREGRRLVNVSVNAWQEDPQTSIARARAHFLLSE